MALENTNYNRSIVAKQAAKIIMEEGITDYLFAKRKAAKSLASEGLPEAIMIDCNHANSGKDPSRQELVLRDAIHQIVTVDNSFIAIMIESNINGGNQPISSSLQYGVSITDACLDWENTNRIILNAHQSLATCS